MRGSPKLLFKISSLYQEKIYPQFHYMYRHIAVLFTYRDRSSIISMSITNTAYKCVIVSETRLKEEYSSLKSVGFTKVVVIECHI